MTHRFVKRHLGSRRPIKFPWYHEIKVEYLGDCTHLITAWFDTLNASGVMTRTPYLAKIKYTGNDSYGLIDLEIDVAVPPDNP